MKNKSLFIAVILIGIAFAVSSCKPSSNAKNTNQVQEYVVQRGNIMESIDVSGFLAAREDETVKALAAGLVTKVYISEGEMVKAGELIAEIEDDEYRLNYEKAKKAYEESLISGSESDKTVKKLEMEIARKNLERTKITSPLDGIVSEVYVKAGDIVGKGGKIARIVSRKLYIEAAVDEIDYGKIDIGNTALITFEALPDSRAFGRVSFISPVAKNSGGLVVFPIEIEIERGRNIEKLAPGMSCEISIIIAKLENVLKIPSDALIQRKGEHYVKVKSDEGIEERKVEVGYIGDFFAEITSGLKEGDIVIVERQTTLKKGSEIPRLMRRLPRR